MTTHELAGILLTYPDVEVVVENIDTLGDDLWEPGEVWMKENATSDIKEPPVVIIKA